MMTELPEITAIELNKPHRKAGHDSSPTASKGDNTLQCSEVYNFLVSLPEFSALPAPLLRSLAERSRLVSVTAGEYITHEGEDESPYGFIVVSGRLAIMKTSINGKELVVDLLIRGDIFGVLLMLSQEKMVVQLSARAQICSRIIWVPKKHLLPMLNTHPELYPGFVSHLLHNLHSSYNLSRGLAHDRVEVRIAAILVTLAIKYSRPSSSPLNHTIDITRQQIADLTGTTPETAIRVTRAMLRKKLIDISRPGIVKVIDLEGLQLMAEGD
jgi:CRP-like cAMP-binding protein